MLYSLNYKKFQGSAHLFQQWSYMHNIPLFQACSISHLTNIWLLKSFFSCSVQNISSYTIQKRECYGRSNSSRGLIAQVSKGQLGSRMILDMIMMMTPNLHIKTYPGPTKHTLLVIWRPEHLELGDSKIIYKFSYILWRFFKEKIFE